jgi:hypothetical protein
MVFHKLLLGTSYKLARYPGRQLFFSQRWVIARTLEARF